LVAEVVSVRKIAAVFWFVLLIKWLIEEGLCDIVLTVYLFWAQTNINDTKEACTADLGTLSITQVIVLVLSEHIQRHVIVSLASACHLAR
jgi:hypothetical protein